ncbi:hypothetical protein L208DRAFT_1384753 [Tricholoma matsutake]|nr:hypothetical protein L208DRAFT_1384753 [Tricholoma matsutake 945]
MLQARRCWLSWRSATMMHTASGNSQALGQELGLMANSSYGSPGTEPPLMHTARGTSQAWEQALGPIIPGSPSAATWSPRHKQAPHPIWMGRAIDWAWLGIVLHPHLAL